MSGVALAVEARSDRGKGAMRRLRQQGFVPGVVYGHGSEAAAFQIQSGSLSKHLRDEGATKLVQLKSDAGDLNDKHILVREVQKDPVSGEFLHVDFQQVNLDQIILMDIKLVFVGTPVGEKLGGARRVLRYSLEVACTADSIPDVIEIDVSELEIGDVLRAGDVPLPEGVTLKTQSSATVFGVETRRTAVAPGAAEGAEQGAEADADTDSEAEGGSEEESSE